MKKFKTARLEILNNIIKSMNEVSQLYTQLSPAWTLIQAASDHFNAIYHLESESNLSDETLGVRFKDKKG